MGKWHRRQSAPGYAGPSSRIALRSARKLGSEWCWVEKKDGVYALALCDASGRITHLQSRTGKQLRWPQARAMIGCRILPGPGLVAGELEAYTEAGEQAAKERGYPLLHLFDALALDGRWVADAPYRERQHLLWSAWARNCDERGEDRGEERDWSTGQWVRRVPMGWRRAPILPTHSVQRFEQLWEDVVLAGHAEGLVACHRDAPVAAKRGKRKVKPYDSIDCVVLEDMGTKLAVRTFGQVFTCQWGGKRRFRAGEVVSVRCDGWYSHGVPRFARVDRARLDLTLPRAA